MIDLVKAVDQDDELLASYQKAPPILADSPLASMTTDFLRNRLREIALAVTTHASVSQRSLFPIRRASYFISTKVRNRVIYTGQRLQELLTGDSSRIAWKSQLTNGGVK